MQPIKEINGTASNSGRESLQDVSDQQWNYLLDKYRGGVPRYTSYPSALYFSELEEADRADLTEDLRANNHQPRDLSVYVHLPFCESLCWYCGCNNIISRNQELADEYLGYLAREIHLTSRYIHPRSRITQLHFGGGTPTFLSAGNLELLISRLQQHFSFADDIEFSVEVDPRVISEDQVNVLAAGGCNRISIGVQDTNEETQKAVNRWQPLQLSRNTVDMARKHGIDAINIDLMYGLPHQTPASISSTVDEIMELNPDRISLFGYAHVPHFKPAQKLVARSGLPDGMERLRLYLAVYHRLREYQLNPIGLDHFARSSDELHQAVEHGSIHRNFQGYTIGNYDDLYAFGISGISRIGNWYVQNQKNLNYYYKNIDAGTTPVIKGYKLTDDDLIRGTVITTLMCHMKIDFADLSRIHNIDAQSYFNEELSMIKELEKDSLIESHHDRILITEKGRLFLRNIVSTFDSYYQNQEQHRYSQSV